MPRPITRAGASGSHDDDDYPNPPPMPSTMADAIAALVYAMAENARLLREMAQNQQALHPNHGHRNNGNDESTYVDFTNTHPHVFSKAEEPLEADNWLRTIEQKFELIHCTEIQKPRFAAQQLRGAAGAWWANLVAVQPAGHQIN